MAPVRVADVTDDISGDGRDAFHAVADSVYAGGPVATPARAAVDHNLSREAFRARQRIFVAYENDTPVGRIGARLSPLLSDEHGHPFGMLGFFESVDRQDVADALFRHAAAWARTRGAARIVGPMDGDTWHRYRVNVGPFARPPFPMEPWNPAYYQALWERAGFRQLESYSSKWIDDVSALLAALEPGVARSESRGVHIRGLDRDRIEDELALVHDISSSIFADAFLYTPIALGEFRSLYAGVERFLDPDLVIFAIAPDGAAVGFVFAYADPALPAVHYKTIGVRAEWRRAAVAAALSHRVYSNALAKGLRGGNHALMRDDNRSQTLDQEQGEVFRRYLLYEWTGQ